VRPGRGRRDDDGSSYRFRLRTGNDDGQVAATDSADFWLWGVAEVEAFRAVVVVAVVMVMVAMLVVVVVSVGLVFMIRHCRWGISTQHAAP
jgi:hypothetical protein